MFYTLDEAKTALGKSEEDIKQLAREGRLREFRDGPRLMFKADQVEALRAELSGGGEVVDLGPSDSGMAIGLADSHGMGSGMSGSGLGSGGSGSGLGMDESGRSPGAGMALKEDTALAADLGLSGSVSGVPSPARHAGSGTGLSGSQGSRAGIDVFQSDEVERVDPSAQTAISSGISEAAPSVEGVGSGSGLLDLTRESDDTSLGAELLDEIAPGGGGSMVGARRPSEGGGGSGLVEIRSSANRPVTLPAGSVIYQEKADPMAPAFAGAALAATIVVIFGAFALITGVLDTSPDILNQIAQKGFLIVFGGGVAVAIVFFVVGLILGKSTTR
jgi:hypothetical protein